MMRLKHENCSCSLKPENYSGSDEHYNYSGSPEHKQCLGSLSIQNECNYENQRVNRYSLSGLDNYISLRDLVRHLRGTKRPAQNLPGISGEPRCQRIAKRPAHNRPSLRGEVQNLCGTKRSVQNPPVMPGEADSTTRSKPVQISEFSDAIKKGGYVKAALWSCASLDHSSGFLQPCRCSISRFKAAVTNCPVLSPGDLTFSTASITSCGTRAATVWDLAFIALVAIPIHSSTNIREYAREKQSVQHLTVLAASLTLVFNTLSTGKTQESQITTPRTVEAAPRRLTKPLIEVTVMAGSQHTQTHTKFTWRFLALSADTRNVISITAATEREARDQPPTGCVMVFAGRLPVQEAYHA